MSEFLPEGLDVDTILVPPCGVQHAEGMASVDTPPSAMTSSVKILSIFAGVISVTVHSAACQQNPEHNSVNNL